MCATRRELLLIHGVDPHTVRLHAADRLRRTARRFAQVGPLEPGAINRTASIRRATAHLRRNQWQRLDILATRARKLLTELPS